MHLQERSLIERLKRYLDELTEACKLRGRLADLPRDLVVSVGKRAKGLRDALEALEEAEREKPPAHLLCVCGRTLAVRFGETAEGTARRCGWTFFPNSPHKDGTNALCPGCQGDGNDD